MKLSVEYKGKPYRIYLKEVVKQKAGVGNYNVLRVNTFYPIESQGELLEIGAMTKTKVTDDLYLYV